MWKWVEKNGEMGRKVEATGRKNVETGGINLEKGRKMRKRAEKIVETGKKSRNGQKK